MLMLVAAEVNTASSKSSSPPLSAAPPVTSAAIHLDEPKLFV
jgi:hypothetical protein